MNDMYEGRVVKQFSFREFCEICENPKVCDKMRNVYQIFAIVKMTIFRPKWLDLVINKLENLAYFVGKLCKRRNTISRKLWKISPAKIFIIPFNSIISLHSSICFYVCWLLCFTGFFAHSLTDPTMTTYYSG
jgi:ABC-type multidrug transport system permease subunit